MTLYIFSTKVNKRFILTLHQLYLGIHALCFCGKNEDLIAFLFMIFFEQLPFAVFLVYGHGRISLFFTTEFAVPVMFFLRNIEEMMAYTLSVHP
jgi:hypothetical protein